MSRQTVTVFVRETGGIRKPLSFNAGTPVSALIGYLRPFAVFEHADIYVNNRKIEDESTPLGNKTFVDVQWKIRR